MDQSGPKLIKLTKIDPMDWSELELIKVDQIGPTEIDPMDQNCATYGTIISFI